MPDQKPAQAPDHALLGQILATVLLAAMDAGAIALNPSGVASNPAEMAGIIQGFLGIWLPRVGPKAPTAVQAPTAAPLVSKL